MKREENNKRNKSIIVTCKKKYIQIDKQFPRVEIYHGCAVCPLLCRACALRSGWARVDANASTLSGDIGTDDE